MRDSQTFRTFALRTFRTMETITVQELKAKLDAGEDIQVIDVREEHEVIEYNFGAQHIPMGDILGRTEDVRRDCPVVVHCRSGKRSAAVISALEQKHDYTNLINLDGGVLAWYEVFEG